MNKLARHFPAYTGSEPYIFLCFADKDAERIEPALGRLYARGCRLWYSMGKAGDRKIYDYNTKRINDASLAVLYLTDNARNDTDVKNDIKHFLNTGKKVIVVEVDEGESYLKLGLPENLPVVSDDEELIRAEGFHAGLLGDRPKNKHRILKTIVAAAMAAALLVGTYCGVRIAGWKPAVSNPEEITVLSLSSFPDNPEELAKYPNLETIIVPQSMAAQALELYGDYRIALTEG